MTPYTQEVEEALAMADRWDGQDAEISIAPAQNALRAAIVLAALVRSQAEEIALLRERCEKVYCAYCSFEAICPSTNDALTEHVKVCEFHPVRAAERQAQERLVELNERGARIIKLEEVIKSISDEGSNWKWWKDRAEAAEAKVAALEKQIEGMTKIGDYQAQVAALSKDLARAREALIAIRQGHESNEVDYMRDERIIGKAFASIPAPEAPSESPSVCSAHQTKDKDCPRCAISFNPSESVGGVCGVDEPCHCAMFGLPKHDAPNSAAGGKANG